MAERIGTPHDKDWEGTTEWVGDFQPALLGAPGEWKNTSSVSVDVPADTSQQLTESVQAVTAVVLDPPEGKNIVQGISTAWNKSALGKLLFFLRRKK